MKQYLISTLKKTIRLNNMPPEVTKNQPRLFEQVYNTFLGLLFVIIILSAYLITYSIMKDKYLSIIIGSILFIEIINCYFFLQQPVKRNRIASNILIITLLIPTYLIALFTGGIISSTIIWFSIFPAVMVFMTGMKNAIIWFILIIFSLLSIYLMPEITIKTSLIGSNFRTETFLDMILISTAIFFVICAIDTSNTRTLKKLKITQARLRILAITDPLTGLYNRRFFKEKAEIELTRSIRYKKSLTLLMLDLDYFKKINDTYGHKAGDYMLKKVSNIFQNNLRDIDFIGRYGGEEFIMLFPESSKETTYIAAERIRKDIEDTYLLFNGEKLKITISIGITEMFDNETESISKMAHRADEALYLSKKNGRNRVTIWDKS